MPRNLVMFEGSKGLRFLFCWKETIASKPNKTQTNQDWNDKKG